MDSSRWLRTWTLPQLIPDRRPLTDRERLMLRRTPAAQDAGGRPLRRPLHRSPSCRGARAAAPPSTWPSRAAPPRQAVHRRSCPPPAGSRPRGSRSRSFCTAARGSCPNWRSTRPPGRPVHPARRSSASSSSVSPGPRRLKRVPRRGVLPAEDPHLHVAEVLKITHTIP